VTFTEIVESPEELREKTEYAKAAITPVDLENMVEVPSGKFLYEDEKREENIERSFLIDIYPVTNAQYEKFIRAGAYTKQEILSLPGRWGQGFYREEYWSEEGRKWREENNITQPRYWDDAKWNQPDHPVVGVSYYEAEAYAKWAGKRLPTEKEWEKAARGTDGREYPWGDGFDKDKCNTNESGIGATSRVTRYPNGVSPYGCYDMAGNVWEWTDSWHEEEKQTKVLRGGSWSIGRGFARCAIRPGLNPDSWGFVIGFRCVRSI
jgi:formylglycine-generating enzyme required for sulfatase activity